MSRIVYNEGRVVGYSAYEIYVKQFKQTNSGGTPATEREWLSASIASGSSLLLYVAADNVSGPHRRDFTLPEGSRLRAANTIVASFFDGEAVIRYKGEFSGVVVDTEAIGGELQIEEGGPLLDRSGFAVRVADYGKLIANNNTYSPSENDSNNIPDYTNGTDFNNAYSDPDHPYLEDIKLKRLMQYIKIDDGIVLQGGTWDEPSDTAQHKSPPKKRFRLVAPRDDNTTIDTSLSNLSSPPRPRIRIAFADQVTQGFYILLTGFTDRAVIEGVTGLTTSTATTSPENGDFLGPAVFPWSAKIIFSQPANLTYYLRQGKFISEVDRTQDSLVMIENSKDMPTTKIKINPTKVVDEGIGAGSGIQIHEEDGRMIVSSPSDADFTTIYSDVNKQFMKRCCWRLDIPGDDAETTLNQLKHAIETNYHTDYTVYGFNGFTSYDEYDRSDGYPWIGEPIGDNAVSTSCLKAYCGQSSASSGAEGTSVNPCISVKVLPSTSTREIGGSDYPTSVQIKITGSFVVTDEDIYPEGDPTGVHKGYASLSKPDFYCTITDGQISAGFGLSHGAAWGPGISTNLRSLMFGIGFNDENMVDNTYRYRYLHDKKGGKLLYSFTDTSSPAIWNIRERYSINGKTGLPSGSDDTIGGSWEATCKLMLNPFFDTYESGTHVECARLMNYGKQNASSSIGDFCENTNNVEIDNDNILLVATAGSYADGYNTQISRWDTHYNENGAGVYARHLNISLSGIFYLREDI